MLSAGGCSGAGATGSRSGKCGGVSRSLSCDMAEASVVVGGMEDGDEMVTRGAVAEGFVLLLVSRWGCMQMGVMSRSRFTSILSVKVR